MGTSNVGINIIDVNKVVGDTIAYQSMRLYQYQVKKEAESVQLSAYGSLQGLITDFQTELNKVNTAFNAVTYSASSSNSSYAKATVTDNAIGAGSHAVDVQQLAQAQSNTAQQSFTSKTTALNINETILFTKTSDSSATYSLKVKPTDTLEDIRDKVNTQNRLGLSAAIVSSDNGGVTQYNLIITSKSGTANEVGITGDTALNFNQTNAAADAKFTYDGYTQVKSSNFVDDVVDGLSFELTGVGLTTITIAETGVNQTENIKNAIQDMLDSYNKVVSFLDSSQFVKVTKTFDTGGESKSTLSSTQMNTSFAFVKQQLEQVTRMYYSGSGDVHTLSDAGIVLDKNKNVVKDQYDTDREVSVYGSLVMDATPQIRYGGKTPLDWNLENNFNSLKDFFTNPDSGFVKKMNDVIDNVIMPKNESGIIFNSQNMIKAQEKVTTDQIVQEQKRLDTMKDDLVLQYAALNASLSSYQTMNTYLEQQYSYLNGLMTGK